MEKNKKENGLFNPVEFVIFLGVIGFFTLSALQLFTSKPQTLLSQMIQSDQNETERKPAFSTVGLGFLEFQCKNEAYSQEINAERVRLSGPICEPNLKEKTPLKAIQVINLDSKNEGEPFIISGPNNFSTNLPLKKGDNNYEIKFKFEKEIISKRLKVIRR